MEYPIINIFGVRFRPREGELHVAMNRDRRLYAYDTPLVKNYFKYGEWWSHYLTYGNRRYLSKVNKHYKVAGKERIKWYASQVRIADIIKYGEVEALGNYFDIVKREDGLQKDLRRNFAHAEEKQSYKFDCLLSHRPYENWESKDINLPDEPENWKTLIRHPFWFSDRDYRRKRA